MKRNFTVIGLLLMVLIAGNGCRHAKHEKNVMKDHSKMMMMHFRQNFRHHLTNAPWSDSLMRRGMRPGMRGMHPGMMRGMRPLGPLGPMPFDTTGWMPLGPGGRIIESVPNITESQKKQVEDLIKKQREEIIKLREEMFNKMHAIIDSHRKEILNILTDEQKKFIEPGAMKRAPAK